MSDSGAGRLSSLPTCREIFAILSEYVDGALPEELCEAIQAHNGSCPPCEAFLATFTKTVELIRAQPTEPLPSDVKNALSSSLQRCRHALGT